MTDPASNNAAVIAEKNLKIYFRPRSSIHLSNLALYNDKLSRGVRFQTRVLNDGSKTRVCVKSGQELSLRK